MKTSGLISGVALANKHINFEPLADGVAFLVLDRPVN